MRVRKTTLQRILEKTDGNYDVPLILAGHFAGFADQTTRNRLSAGTLPFSTYLIGRRRFVHAGELAVFIDAQRSARRVLVSSLIPKRR